MRNKYTENDIVLSIHSGKLQHGHWTYLNSCKFHLNKNNIGFTTIQSHVPATTLQQCNIYKVYLHP